ncbi:MAG: hypothetical protein K2Y12_02510 [Chitinophagaceae bacterium]|nr:hypothetical protein [Chitinophagaceae bacterium]
MFKSILSFFFISVLSLELSAQTFSERFEKIYYIKNNCTKEAHDQKEKALENLYSKSIWVESNAARVSPQCKAHRKEGCTICQRILSEEESRIEKEYENKLKKCQDEYDIQKRVIELEIEVARKKKDLMIKEYQSKFKNTLKKNPKGDENSIYVFVVDYLGSSKFIDGKEVLENEYYISEVFDFSKIANANILNLASDPKFFCLYANKPEASLGDKFYCVGVYLATQTRNKNFPNIDPSLYTYRRVRTWYNEYKLMDQNIDISKKIMKDRLRMEKIRTDLIKEIRSNYSNKVIELNYF